jgi:hypothetical protein
MSLAHFDEIYEICNYEAEKDRLFDKEISLTDVTFKKSIQTSKVTISTLTNLNKKEESTEISLV